MHKYHIGTDMAKDDDIGCCAIMKGKTILADFYGPQCEEQALKWLLAKLDSADADLAAALREIAAWKDYAESLCRIVGGKYLFYKERFGVANKTSAELSRIIDAMEQEHVRVAELLKEGVVVTMTTPNVVSDPLPTAQPKYREPTIEDAMELLEIPWAMRAEQLLPVLKQLNFYRKVQP